MTWWRNEACQPHDAAWRRNKGQGDREEGIGGRNWNIFGHPFCLNLPLSQFCLSNWALQFVMNGASHFFKSTGCLCLSNCITVGLRGSFYLSNCIRRWGSLGIEYRQCFRPFSLGSETILSLPPPICPLVITAEKIRHLSISAPARLRTKK